MTSSIDSCTRYRLARPIVLYLRPDGELVMPTEGPVLPIRPEMLELLVRLASGAAVEDLVDATSGQSDEGLRGVFRAFAAANVIAPQEEMPPTAEELVPISPPPRAAEPEAFFGAARLQLARSSLVMLSQHGALYLWIAKDASFRAVDPRTLRWIRELGRVATPRDVERALDVALVEEDRALLEDLVRHSVVRVLSGRQRAAIAATSADEPARRRIDKLIDAGSWVENGTRSLGTITGSATVDGRTVVIVAYAPWAGPLTAMEAPIKKVLRAQESALRTGAPLLYLFGDGGPSEASGSIDSFLGDDSWGRVYHNQVVLSGRAPQLGAIFGACTMPTSFPPALCDVLTLVDGDAFLGVAPPPSVKRWLGAEVDRETLGGARMHCTVAGTGDLLAASEDEAIAQLRAALSYFPVAFGGGQPVPPQPPASGPPLAEVIPEEADRPFDVLEAIRAIIDADSLFELKRGYAKELVTVLARIDGAPVGIVANNSRFRGGIMFPESCEKEARFVSLCDAYEIPLLFLVDSPGYMIGPGVERAGLLRATARLYGALVEATVPKITVVLRKAHTGSVYAMCGPCFNPDCFLAVPTARIAILGAKATYDWLAGAERVLPSRMRDSLKKHIDLRSKQDMSPAPLATQMAVDALIDFADLRRELAARYARLTGSPTTARGRRKHVVSQM